MAVNYDKLGRTDYTAHEHTRDFERKIEDHGISDPLISVDWDYDGDVPVVEAEAEDQLTGMSFSETYRLEEVSEEEFEDVMYDVWRETLMELQD